MHGHFVRTPPRFAPAFVGPVATGRSPGEPIAFRRYLVLPAARALLRDGVPVDIGGRAFDLLLVLLQARGTIVGKDKIVQHVWPSTFVDEGNLRFQMAMLRKALGDDRDLIKTVTGRGYLLIDEQYLPEEPAAASAVSKVSSVSGSTHFKTQSERLAGRLGRGAPESLVWTG